MPFSWNTDTERAMLLVVCAEMRPSLVTFKLVADRLGGGLSASAVRNTTNQEAIDKLLAVETPKRGLPQDDGKYTGTGTDTKRKGARVTDTTRETPSKRSKRQIDPIDLDALAADDDGEDNMKTEVEAEDDEMRPVFGSSKLFDLEMEEEGRDIEEA